MASKKKEQPVRSDLVRAKVTHTEPETHIYREEGSVYPYTGKLYKHIEPVDPQPETEDEDL